MFNEMKVKAAKKILEQNNDNPEANVSFFKASFYAAATSTVGIITVNNFLSNGPVTVGSMVGLAATGVFSAKAVSSFGKSLVRALNK